MIVSKLSQPQPDVVEDLPGLYEDTYPAVAAFVSKMGGSYDDAKDIFHDSLIIFLERGPDVQNASAYILGIAKHLWLRKYNLDKHNVDIEGAIEIPEEEHSPIVTRLLKLVESAGKNCLELLQSFYYERQTAENIAARFKYSSTHSVTVQKHKCLQKLRNFVKAKSLDYESFIE